MGKPGPKAYSVINDLLKKGSPFKQQKLNKKAVTNRANTIVATEAIGGMAGEMAGKASGKKSKVLKRYNKNY